MRKSTPDEMFKDVVFVLGERSFTLQQFYDVYKDCLPAFVVVTQGYCGENQMEELGYGQVLKINSCVTQERAAAVDAQNRTLTIPLNYQLMFKAVNKGRKARSMADIVSKYGVPVDVQICDPKEYSLSLNDSRQNVKLPGTLTVNDVFAERYFLATTINNGKPYESSILIPLYLKNIIVSDVIGIQGQTTRIWKEYQAFVDQSHPKLDIPLDTGIMEIAIYPQETSSARSSDSHVYDVIEPSTYIVADWAGKDWSKRGHSLYSIAPPRRRAPPEPPATQPPDVPPRLPERSAPKKRLDLAAKVSHHQYVNNVGRVTVAPFQHVKHTETTRHYEALKHTIPEVSKADKQYGTTEVKYQALSVVNHADHKAVHLLTIDELGEKLKQLKLEKYLRIFLEKGVDGDLASDLSETILTDEFQFTRFEALKFLKFVRTGHIAK